MNPIISPGHGKKSYQMVNKVIIRLIFYFMVILLLILIINRTLKITCQKDYSINEDNLKWKTNYKCSIQLSLDGGYNESN
jgi:hypothetical protein